MINLLTVLKEYTSWLLGWFTVAMIISLVIRWLPIFRDDSDEPGWFGNRSGIKPVTDNLTGCQYLITSEGGITPRLDADGKHVCKFEKVKS